MHRELNIYVHKHMYIATALCCAQARLFFVDIWGCFEDIQVLFRGYEGLHKYIHICKYDIFVLVHVLPQLRKHVYNEKYIIYTYMNIYV